MTTKRNSIVGPQVLCTCSADEFSTGFFPRIVLAHAASISFGFYRKWCASIILSIGCPTTSRRRRLCLLEREGSVKTLETKIFIEYFVLPHSWVRFEEIAENVLGRWSKPHVATLMQSALLDLKNLLNRGVILLNVTATDLSTLSRKKIYLEFVRSSIDQTISMFRNDGSRFTRCPISRWFNVSTKAPMDSLFTSFSSSRKTFSYENSQFH